MRTSQTGFLIYVIAILMVVGVGIGGGLWYFFYREGIDPFTVQRSGVRPARAREASTAGSRKKEDINDDGMVDQTDAGIIRQNIGCASGQTCWGGVIGKTLSGDNPIYAADLDMDGNGMIEERDVELITAQIGQL
ncbi:MAG: dockerin type I domain-containing protein [Patescibacteria group bacterium]|nr:dockerin type I domain-containing protein [Patescibacteria group bacterium]